MCAAAGKGARQKKCNAGDAPSCLDHTPRCTPPTPANHNHDHDQVLHTPSKTYYAAAAAAFKR